jgi:gliding motility-associated-like protein
LKAVFFTLLMLLSVWGWSQTFPIKGQYPSTPFPVCGADTIHQAAVPLGLTTTIPVPGCVGYPDVNPFYYTFTCFTTGTLGFTIVPNDPGDDYDWMIFDYTGILPSIIYTDSNLIVTGNRSATPGVTGTDNNGVTFSECPGQPNPLTIMPTLVKGHQYLLLVTHPQAAQSGYSLFFKGGTAVIDDPAPPRFLSVVVGCDKKTLTVGITKFVRCNSLAADGSDFVISTSTGSIAQAVGLNCNPQFDFDYLELTLSDPLSPGNYELAFQSGSDGNTLLDDCGSQAFAGDKISFTVSGTTPTLDSIVPPVCAPKTIQILLSDPIQCGSIAGDGSDFIISGSSVATAVKAEGTCSANLTKVITLTLASPIAMDGAYQVTLVTGSDGNTIVDQCGNPAAAGSMLSFSVKGAVSASFDYNIAYGCKNDTINLEYQPTNGVNQWLWTIDSTISSSSLSPGIVESVFGLKNVQHVVSNSQCNDTAIKTVNLDNILKAQFQSPSEICPKDLISFSNTSIGNIVSYYWDFGDGTSSTSQNPSDHLFPDSRNGKTYPVSLTVQNNMGCLDTGVVQITKLQSCIITVPNAFTPNGDGKNDFLYPLNAFSVGNLEFRVFNRYGQLIFETRDWSKKWDGTINGHLQPTGTYIWMLQYTDGSGKKIFQQGSSVLIR